MEAYLGGHAECDRDGYSNRLRRTDTPCGQLRGGMLLLPRGIFAAVLSLSLAAAIRPTVVAGDVRIDADFPGGNIVCEKIEGETIYIRQDLRDTQGDWFYWYFRVRGAEGKTLKFQFTGSDVIGLRGPGVSIDGGITWKWLGRQTVEGKSFRFAFPADVPDVRFSMAMPYVEENLKRFLSRWQGRPEIKVDVLCKTKKGRSAELLYLGRLDGNAPFRVAFTCRHHACEMMASYVLEGIMETVLTDDDIGRWYRDNVEMFIVPFVDKDGVEDGDQGKNRKPHDHNRDYGGQSIHPTVAAIREKLPAWGGGRLRVAIDLHCPSLRDQVLQFVGGPDEDNWKCIGRLAAILEKVQQGPLVFSAADNIPFGKGWNNNPNARTFSRFAAAIPGVWVGSTIEVPYATARGKEVNADSARRFGRDVAAALMQYLTTDKGR